jgi:hypothetical protein
MPESEKKPITWQFTLGNGKTVSVAYYPRWSYCHEPDLQYRTDHFEFRGEAISSTSRVGFDEWEGQLDLF